MMQPLLMIPGPVEISPGVRAAHDVAPPSHTAPDLIEAYGDVLRATIRVWGADERSEALVIPGSGTTAMELAAANLLREGSRVVVVNTGYFSLRMVEIARRYGAHVQAIDSAPGERPDNEAIRLAIENYAPEVVFATHVDTSTGVRVDPEVIVRAAGDALTVFDGVCATAAEPFEMAKLGADVYLTGSQKALGLPAGLALAVFSHRALKRRSQIDPPPLVLDIESWRPIMHAYLEGRPSYFATPATNLVMAARVALQEIEHTQFEGQIGMPARVALHRRAARAMNHAWRSLELRHLADEEARGVTLSALKVPQGIQASIPQAVAKRGVSIAGGLYPGLQKTTFRVGHMGYCVTQPEMLERTVGAVAEALSELGVPAAEPNRAIAAFRDAWGGVRP